MLEYNVTEWADQLKLSKRQLQRIVKVKLHRSPREFLMVKRLHEAIVLMVHEKYSSLVEIAEHSGFKNYDTFRKTFLRELKMNPSSCRHMLRNAATENQKIRFLLWIRRM